mmetsp:Transcript_17978/g.57017  ORF Transcript_17978/g.57017 Transcript_17978/m.57017 type:complete len:130 (+) Transcript_17978:94-483(+)
MGATTSAMGRAFQGRTRSERPTLEKPALSEDIGSTAAEAVAAAYGRRRHVDMLLMPPKTPGLRVARPSVTSALRGRSGGRACRAATMLRRASAFHGEMAQVNCDAPTRAQECSPRGPHKGGLPACPTLL